MSLPTDAKARKAVPLCTGLLDYFPDALAEVAEVSRQGNDQHNPGQPLHWAREKSSDHLDCAVRHIVDHGKVDIDGRRHLGKAAWRILAELQLEIEREKANELNGPVRVDWVVAGADNRQHREATSDHSGHA